MSSRHRWQRIRRRDEPHKQTIDKDTVADFIEEQIDQGNWPMELTEVAEETGYSRTHVQNTLDDYFERIEDETNDTTQVQHNGIEIEIPHGVDRESYLRGWIEGYLRNK